MMEELEYHWSADDKLVSEGKARVFGYTEHKLQGVRNVQLIAAVGIECEFCSSEDDVHAAVGYGKCFCCNETVWICNDCSTMTQ
jgi:hypothetical protein